MSRRIWFTAAIVAGLLVLAGCGPRPEYVFTDQEGARSYLLVRLAEKYGVEFQVLHATFNDGEPVPGSIPRRSAKGCPYWFRVGIHVHCHRRQCGRAAGGI